MMATRTCHLRPYISMTIRHMTDDAGSGLWLGLYPNQGHPDSVFQHGVAIERNSTTGQRVLHMV